MIAESLTKSHNETETMMGIFFRDPQLDRIEQVADRIDTNTRNLLAAAVRIEKTQEAMMSKTDDALGRLATAVVSAVTQLQQSRAEAQASKATADAVVANDAAEDAAQLDAQDTSSASAIDSAVAILVEALKDPEVPANPPADPPAEPTEPAAEPAPPGEAPAETSVDVPDPSGAGEGNPTE